jgi:hypothetical protein
VSWIRYDDAFWHHEKVREVVAVDPGAIGLHVLGSTYSAATSRPGFLPESQLAVLVGSRRQGLKWATLLEQHGLLHSVEGGWVYHDFDTYNPLEELRAKRKAAGSKGGKAAAAKRANATASAQANGEQMLQQVLKQTGQQTGQQKGSTVPLASTKHPISTPPGAADAAPTSTRDLIAEHVEACRIRPPERFMGQLGKQVQALLGEGIDPEHVRAALTILRVKALGPSTLPSLVNEIMNPPSRTGPTARRPATEVAVEAADKAIASWTARGASA